MQMIVIELLQIITQGIEWLIRYLWHLETLVLKSKIVTLWQLIFLKVQNIINMHGQTARLWV